MNHLALNDDIDSSHKTVSRCCSNRCSAKLEISTVFMRHLMLIDCICFALSDALRYLAKVGINHGDTPKEIIPHVIN